jgi:hypothetical protein
MKKKLALALFSLLLFAYSSFGQHRQNMMTLDERIDLSEIIIEGEVIEKESYFDHSDNEIYTINRIKIYKQFKGNYVPDEISLVTAGGQVGDTIERVFHSFQVSTHTKGVFFFKQSRINHPLKQFPTKTQEVVAQQGFIRYYHLDNEKRLVAGSAYEDFNNIETELLQVIEQKVGQKRIVKNLTNEEQQLQNWINKQSITKNGNGGSIVEYTIANPSLTGSFNEFLEFDINIASLLSSEEFFSGELLIDYNTLTFGSNLAASGIVNITKGNVILTPNYTITITDISASKLKIEVVSSSNNPNTLYLIDNTADQLVHLKIDITNLAGNTGIEFDEINMQGASEFFDISSNVIEPFELVKADDELDVDVNALVVPTIIDFYPKTVRGGIDTITIVGTGFGQFQDLGYVEFTNAENGLSPVEWIRAHHKEYILWKNDTIKVKVTSHGTDNNTGFYDFGAHYAGTGKIRVISDNGQISPSSLSTLNVTFSIFNDIGNDNGNFRPAEMILINGNNNGGYTLTFDTSFTNNISVPGAQQAFERALVTWRCQTGVNFIINDTVPNTPSGNEILIKFDNTLNAAVARTAMWFFPDCSSSPNPYLRRFSMTFSTHAPNEWYTGTDTTLTLGLFEYDLETISLHELGHAHLLNHNNDNSNTMWWLVRPISNPYFRYLDATAILGGQYVINESSTNPVPSGTCLSPMIAVPSSQCDIINTTNAVISDEIVNIYPNPTNQYLHIELENNSEFNHLLIVNLQGQEVYGKKISTNVSTIDISTLAKGIYFLVIQSPKGFVTKKIIKH